LKDIIEIKSDLFSDKIVACTLMASEGILASDGRTVVEHSSPHPKVKGLSPVTPAATGMMMMVNRPIKI